jgi:hypothetical protein
MSTKAHGFYRLRRGHDLFDLIEDVTRQARRAVRATLAARIRHYIEHPVLRQRELGKTIAADPVDPEATFGPAPQESIVDYPDPWKISRRLREKFQAAVADPDTYSAFDFRVRCAIWGHHGRHYLKDYTDWMTYERISHPSNPLHCLTTHPWLEDYSYWNNTDGPDEVSPQAWGQRKRVWGGPDGLTDDRNWYGRRVLIDIFSPDLWYQLDPCRAMDWSDAQFAEWGTPPENVAHLRAYIAEHPMGDDLWMRERS